MTGAVCDWLLLFDSYFCDGVQKVGLALDQLGLVTKERVLVGGLVL